MLASSSIRMRPERAYSVKVKTIKLNVRFRLFIWYIAYGDGSQG